MYRITKKELVDAISIPIMTISRNVYLSHKVKLSKPDRQGKRDYYHKEFTYASKYNSLERLTTLRLSHSSILSIENKNSDGMESLIINVVNRDFIVKSLSMMKKIMKDPDLFIEKDDEYIINPKLKKQSSISFEPYRDKLILLRPCVITYENQDAIDGVAMSLDSRNLSFIEIPTETFKVLIRYIKKFDFHTSGLAALTYLQSTDIGKYEIDIVRTTIDDFDTDVEPVYRPQPSMKNDDMGGLNIKNKGEKNRGW